MYWANDQVYIWLHRIYYLLCEINKLLYIFLKIVKNSYSGVMSVPLEPFQVTAAADLRQLHSKGV